MWNVLERDLLDGHEVAILQVKPLVDTPVRALPYLISEHVFVVERLRFVVVKLPRPHLRVPLPPRFKPAGRPWRRRLRRGRADRLSVTSAEYAPPTSSPFRFRVWGGKGIAGSEKEGGAGTREKEDEGDEESSGARESVKSGKTAKATVLEAVVKVTCELQSPPYDAIPLRHLLTEDSNTRTVELDSASKIIG